jgi:hypothetical protein
VPLARYGLVEDELLSTRVGDPRPTELKLANRFVESREPPIDPGLHVQDVRVLAIGARKQKRPPSALLASGPHVGELAQELGQLGWLDRLDRLDRPPPDERVGSRRRRLEPLLHRQLRGRERCQIEANTLRACSRSRGHAAMPAKREMNMNTLSGSTCLPGFTPTSMKSHGAKGGT